MKKTILAAALVTTLGAAAGEAMTWEREELFDAPQILPDTGLEKYRVDGVRSFLLEGPRTADGKRTYAYAYYALPDGEAPEGGFPAVVLFHGGGGTAFASYVKTWRDRGYAAITFDHYGQEPAADLPRPQRPVLKDSWHHYAGTFGEGDNAMRHLWVHNGVALAVRANTFLRAQKEINPDKIGLLGISWGSVMGSIAASLDGRFAYAALCYGCGHWDLGADLGILDPERAAK
ncbi:MAG: acetylxylan esterase, partial [Victivallaceae bacterium]|nr:acetylxylan esterase [Victivallaceae bacterium]